MPQVEVAFNIEHKGILHVAAKDLGTGKEQKIRIESSSGLSSSEVERMQHEAERNADEDRKRRELIDERNKADQMVYQMEKLLKDNANKIGESDKRPIQSAIEKVKRAQKADDLAGLKQAVAELEQASHAKAQHLYKQGGPGAAGGGPQAGGAAPSGDGKGGKEDVIDAEYEVKK